MGEPDVVDPPLPIQFQILYNYQVSPEHDALRKNKIHMHPAFACELNGTCIYRLIDHDLEQHTISAGQLWKACGLTITEGLFLFDLKIADYEVDFMLPHFPFCDVWVTVPKARYMASVLNVQEELELLCLAEHDTVFSSDNITRGELVHNWKLESIPNALYSTRALLETEVTAPLKVLSSHRKIRTQISRTRQPGMVCKDRLETGLVRMAVAAYEQFSLPGDDDDDDHHHHHKQQQQISPMSPMSAMGATASGASHGGGKGNTRSSSSSSSNNNNNNISSSSSSSSSDDMASGAVWDVFQGLLFDLQNCSLQRQLRQTHARVFQDSMMIGNMPLKREYLVQGQAIQNVYVASMVEKIANEIVLAQPASTFIVPDIPTAGQRVVPSPLQQQSLPGNGGSSALSQNYHQQTPITTSVSTSNHSFSDPNMLLHDRMDALEQEMYKMKRKAKRRADDLDRETQELQQQIVTLEIWKVRNERSRKSERLWILMACITALVALWIMRS